MKKLILSAAVALFAITGAQAQTAFGLKGGLNVSNLSGSGINSDNTKSLVGANAGLFASIPAATNFYIQPELSYSLEGAQYKTPNAKTKLNFVNIPVMLKYVTNSGFFVEAGPQLGILTSAKNEAGNITADIKNDLKSTNFSLGGGIGYKLDPSLAVGARYMAGISDLSETNSSELKSNNLSINLFYTFGR
jgi:opacity protein-like surface antigen